jgi:hypothetical protein
VYFISFSVVKTASRVRRKADKVRIGRGSGNQCGDAAILGAAYGHCTLPAPHQRAHSCVMIFLRLFLHAGGIFRLLSREMKGNAMALYAGRAITGCMLAVYE